MKLRLSTLLLVLVLLVTACVAPAAPAGDAAPAASDAAPAAAAGGGEMHTAWPYAKAPNGHFNTFVTDGYAMEIYHWFLEPALFMYMWSDQSWMPFAGKEWKWENETTLRVTIPSGAVWSDGSKYTSQDIVDTFSITRLLNSAEWRNLSEVKAVDETTVDFILKEPSTTTPRRVLRQVWIRASSTYGEWAKKVNDLVAAGKTPDDQEWKDAVTEFTAFRPDDMVVLGPYKIDKATITDSQMTLNKVPTSFMADWVKFDKIQNYNGETPDVTPLILAGEVDYATHGFPVATEKEYIAQGIRIIRAPVYSGPALYFNHTVHPFEMKEVRQAIAYAINKEENGAVSLGDSGKAQKYMAGVADDLVEGWVDADTKAKLNSYAYDVAKAEEILTGLGFKKDADGVWMDDKGARMEYELTAPAEFADWSAAAENLAEQLTKFGIKTTYKGVPFQQHPLDVADGKFTLAIRCWGAGNPHPQFAYENNLRTSNPAMSGVGDPTKPGMSFNMVQGDVDFNALIDEAGAGADLDAQKAAVSKLAAAYNDVLPEIPLWHRYGNNAAPDIRVTGWPADGDPVYQNGTYADPFVAVLLAKGILQPK